jgi:hypothetical protein
VLTVDEHLPQYIWLSQEVHEIVGVRVSAETTQAGGFPGSHGPGNRIAKVLEERVNVGNCDSVVRAGLAISGEIE